MKRRALIASSAHVVEYEQMPVNIFFTANEIRSQTPRVEVRHARIQQFIAGRSVVPTVKEVVFELNLIWGIKVCDKTIRRDYTALGIKNPHTPGENISGFK
jgi:hypothetical protein